MGAGAGLAGLVRSAIRSDRSARSAARRRKPLPGLREQATGEPRPLGSNQSVQLELGPGWNVSVTIVLPCTEMGVPAAMFAGMVIEHVATGAVMAHAAPAPQAA
jgi:hypothetical protein